MPLGFMVFTVSFVVASVALDAAFYWRFRNLLEVFREVPDGLDYWNFAFPRLLFISGSATIVAWGSYSKPTDSVLIVVGCGMFLCFSSYPHIAVYLRSKRIE